MRAEPRSASRCGRCAGGTIRFRTSSPCAEAATSSCRASERCATWLHWGGEPQMRLDHPQSLAAKAWQPLALIMLVNGTLGLLAPRFLIRRVGADPEVESGMIYVFRMFGIRTLFIAVDLFRLPEQREQSLREGVVVHATDAGAAFTAAMLGQLP